MWKGNFIPVSVESQFPVQQQSQTTVFSTIKETLKTFHWQITSFTGTVPVVGGHHEVEQQPDGLLHVDLVGGGQPLVELVVDGRQDGLQPRHIDLSVVVQRVQPVVTKGFDHVPDIHQVNCGVCVCVVMVGGGGYSHQSHFCWWHERQIFKLPRALTVASFLHKPEFAGSPVSRQSDYVKILSSCGGKHTKKAFTKTSQWFFPPGSWNKNSLQAQPGSPRVHPNTVWEESQHSEHVRECAAPAEWQDPPLMAKAPRSHIHSLISMKSCLFSTMALPRLVPSSIILQHIRKQRMLAPLLTTTHATLYKYCKTRTHVYVQNALYQVCLHIGS